MVSRLEVFIMTIRKETGKSVSVPYLDDEPIFSLMQRVSKELGEKEQDIYRQEFYIDNKKLKDFEQSAETIRIFGRRLEYEYWKRTKITLTINYVASRDSKEKSEVFTMDCNTEDTAEQLKEVIQARTGIPAYDQRLLYDGERIFRDLGYYYIENGDTLDLLRGQYGGGVEEFCQASCFHTSLLVRQLPSFAERNKPRLALLEASHSSNFLPSIPALSDLTMTLPVTTVNNVKELFRRGKHVRNVSKEPQISLGSAPKVRQQYKENIPDEN
ncbi:hypothetical protein BGX26_010130 [Mortierella sp. AD094]|nr:hypothetical protein BGX26_010130 [Mortierella sp. AD094]